MDALDELLRSTEPSILHVYSDQYHYFGDWMGHLHGLQLGHVRQRARGGSCASPVPT